MTLRPPLLAVDWGDTGIFPTIDQAFELLDRGTYLIWGPRREDPTTYRSGQGRGTFLDIDKEFDVSLLATESERLALQRPHLAVFWSNDPDDQTPRWLCNASLVQRASHIVASVELYSLNHYQLQAFAEYPIFNTVNAPELNIIRIPPGDTRGTVGTVGLSHSVTDDDVTATATNLDVTLGETVYYGYSRDDSEDLAGVQSRTVTPGRTTEQFDSPNLAPGSYIGYLSFDNFVTNAATDSFLVTEELVIDPETETDPVDDTTTVTPEPEEPVEPPVELPPTDYDVQIATFNAVATSTTNIRVTGSVEDRSTPRPGETRDPANLAVSVTIERKPQDSQEWIPTSGASTSADGTFSVDLTASSGDRVDLRGFVEPEVQRTAQVTVPTTAPTTRTPVVDRVGTDNVTETGFRVVANTSFGTGSEPLFGQYRFVLESGYTSVTMTRGTGGLFTGSVGGLSAGLTYEVQVSFDRTFQSGVESTLVTLPRPVQEPYVSSLAARDMTYPGITLVAEVFTPDSRVTATVVRFRVGGQTYRRRIVNGRATLSLPVTRGQRINALADVDGFSTPARSLSFTVQSVQSVAAAAVNRLQARATAQVTGGASGAYFWVRETNSRYQGGSWSNSVFVRASSGGSAAIDITTVPIKYYQVRASLDRNASHAVTANFRAGRVTQAEINEVVTIRRETARSINTIVGTITSLDGAQSELNAAASDYDAAARTLDSGDFQTAIDRAQGHLDTVGRAATSIQTSLSALEALSSSISALLASTTVFTVPANIGPLPAVGPVPPTPAGNPAFTLSSPYSAGAVFGGLTVALGATVTILQFAGVNVPSALLPSSDPAPRQRNAAANAAREARSAATNIRVERPAVTSSLASLNSGLAALDSQLAALREELRAP